MLRDLNFDEPGARQTLEYGAATALYILNNVKEMMMLMKKSGSEERLDRIGKGTQKQLFRRRNFSQRSMVRTCSGGGTSVSFPKGNSRWSHFEKIDRSISKRVPTTSRVPFCKIRVTHDILAGESMSLMFLSDLTV
jgi:hypothetical protein